MTKSNKGLFSLPFVIGTCIAFLIAYFLVGGDIVGAGAVSKAAKGAAIPDMHFSYDAEALVPIFIKLGVAGRAAYLGMNTVDFFFAAIYGAFYFITLGWLAKKLFPAISALRFIGLVGVVGALCDETENIVFRLIASGDGGLDGSLSPIAAIASPLKFSFVLCSMALILAGFIALAFKAYFSRSARK